MKSKFILFSAIMILCCVGLAFAQIGYLKIDDIEGESTERGHKDWIIIESLSHGLAEPEGSTTGPNRRRASVDLNDVIIIKKLDKSSPKLMKACASGQFFPKLEIDLVSADGNVYYKLTLNKAQITSINSSSICDPNCNTIDEVSFSYSKITWEYWDSEGNKVTESYNAQTGN